MAHLHERECTMHNTRQQCDTCGSARAVAGQLANRLLKQFVLGLKPVILRVAFLTAVGEINFIRPCGDLLMCRVRRLDMFVYLCHGTLDG